MEYLTFFFTWTTLGWIAIAVVLAALVVNLLSAGRRGWAWPLLAVLLALAMLILRGGASLFREISSDYDGTGGWDSE